MVEDINSQLTNEQKLKLLKNQYRSIQSKLNEIDIDIAAIALEKIKIKKITLLLINGGRELIMKMLDKKLDQLLNQLSCYTKLALEIDLKIQKIESSNLDDQ